MRRLLLVAISFAFITGCSGAKQMYLGTAMQVCGEHCTALHPDTTIIGIAVNVTPGGMENGIIDQCICTLSNGETSTIDRVKSDKQLVVEVE